jgi:hypothetical protein
MSYIDMARMASIDPAAFQNAEPFPWVNPEGFLTADGFSQLTNHLPDLSLFTASFNVGRKYGQQTHDRYILEYRDGITIPVQWEAFINVLRSDDYRQFIVRLLAHKHFRFRFHWHYAPAGCSVSPHCDSKTKLGSHIFYMNTTKDWNADWGGETILLDDKGQFRQDSRPAFEDFAAQAVAETMNNRSLIFGRRGNSWHGVKAINCPEGKLRKVFIVVFEDYRPNKILTKRIKRFIKGKPLITEKERTMY